jgi:hypothetical protein
VYPLWYPLLGLQKCNTTSPMWPTIIGHNARTLGCAWLPTPKDGSRVVWGLKQDRVLQCRSARASLTGPSLAPTCDPEHTTPSTPQAFRTKLQAMWPGGALQPARRAFNLGVRQFAPFFVGQAVLAQFIQNPFAGVPDRFKPNRMLNLKDFIASYDVDVSIIIRNPILPEIWRCKVQSEIICPSSSYLSVENV